MTKILIVLVIAFTFEAFGVILLKKGIDQIAVKYDQRKATLPVWRNVLKLVGNWFANKDVLAGLLLETIFFILLQYLLGQREVSFVWPLTALSFVMTTLAAQFFLHERVDAMRWGGVALIVIGAALVSYSEQAKAKPPEPSAVSQTTTISQ
ncbi:MAG TPA: EamA family transporter [Verrucomicrobiae bacterium]|nr:EamA family transporter [Verrucomicrobiae bacterium]